MLTAIDEHTFTVNVSNDMIRRHTENNRALLESLMEKRTGKHRIMQVKTGETRQEEISVEEAAARASEILGTEVGIE